MRKVENDIEKRHFSKYNPRKFTSDRELSYLDEHKRKKRE